MRLAVVLFSLLLWSMPARAQQPLLACFNSYDCCVQRFRDTAPCGPSTESAARQVVGKLHDASDLANATASLSTAIDGESVNTLLVRTAEPPRTLEQIAEIEARLVEASTKMGESVEELLPCR